VDAECDAVFLRVAGHDQEDFIDDFFDVARPEAGLAAGQGQHGRADFAGLVGALERLGQGLADEVHVRGLGLGRFAGRIGCN